MEIQSMEKHRDNTNCGDYQGQSIVECDLKMESGARESNVKCFESTEQMMQTERLLKEKEREAEMWEGKYNKIKEELVAMAAILDTSTTENQKTLEVRLRIKFFF